MLRHGVYAMTIAYVTYLSTENVIYAMEYARMKG